MRDSKRRGRRNNKADLGDQPLLNTFNTVISSKFSNGGQVKIDCPPARWGESNLESLSRMHFAIIGTSKMLIHSFNAAALGQLGRESPKTKKLMSEMGRKG